MSELVWIILAGAVVTYMSRAGGHLVLSRFDRIHPRVEAALDAVPAAVLTTLVAPAAVHGGPAEIAALGAAGAVALAGGGMTKLFLVGAAVLVAGRYLIG